MSFLYEKPLSEIRSQLLAKECTVTEAVEACLARIEETEPSIQALLSVQAEEARAQAKAMDEAGPDASKPLWGVPVTVKDLLCVKGTKTTCGSKILENFEPFYDAFAIEKLKEAGAVIIGKANMDEFAMGSSTENSAYKATKNPWALDRVPGGSSGGSAASVTAHQAFATLGTDTGGSIRQPASLCGCVGIKPTYGRVSRRGMVAYGSSLDQIGPMTRTVEDNARMLQVIAGHDERDSTSVDVPVDDYLAALGRTDLKGLKIGLPKEFWAEGLDTEVETACRAAVSKLEALGAERVEVELPHSSFAIATYYILAMAEASSNLARFDGVRYGHRSEEAKELLDIYVKSRSEAFGEEVQRRIMLGTYVLSSGYYDAYYKKAAQVRRLIREDYRKALEQCDVLVGPASPVTAWKVGEFTSDPLKMYLLDIYTISLNLAGLPGISLPVGLGVESNMPVGLQILGKEFDEATLYSVASVLEKNTDTLGAPAGL